MVRSVLWPCYYCRIWFHCSSVSRKVVLVAHYFLVLSNFQKLWYHPIFPRPYPSLGLYTTVLPSRHQALDYSSRCVHFKDGWPHPLYVDFLRFTVTSQPYFPVPMRHPSPGDLPNPGIKSASPASPALAGGFFTTETPVWKARDGKNRKRREWSYSAIV